MKLAIVLLVIAFISGASSVPASHEVNHLTWQKNVPLTWSDFRGNIDPRSRGDAAATITIKAKPYLRRNKVRYDVIAIFVRNESWCRTTSANLLAHEQIHFDIAEVFARKARKKISELRAKGISNSTEINRSIQHIMDESNAEDHRYDAETLHGALRDKQSKWTRSVAIELQILQLYERNAWNARQ